MVWPLTQLEPVVEIYLGSTLGWVDISADCRQASAASGGGITISGGTANLGNQPDPTKCTITLNNKSGKYSPRNPYSPYFGLLGRNTPIRVTIPEADPGSSLRLSAWNTGDRRGAAVTAPYHSSMGITGDLELRFWGRHHDAQWRNPNTALLAARYQIAGNNRSWSFAVTSDGYPYLSWSTDGTLANLTPARRASAPLPPVQGDRAVRVWLDVDTGLGTHALRWWTGPTINGPWTQLGVDVSIAGTTSVFAGASAGTRIGWEPDLGAYGFDGEVLGFEMRSGLAGAKVCSPDFTTATPGATSVTDSQGRVFTLDAADRAYISDRGTRFLGEVAAWPVEWDLSGNDVWVSLEAADITRRLQQGDSFAMSPLRRTLSSLNPAAYLPLEDGSQSNRASSAVTGVPTAENFGVSFGADNSLPGAATAAQLGSAGTSLMLPVAAPAASNTWSVLFLFKLAQAATGGDTTAARIWLNGGSIARWDFLISSLGFRWAGYNSAGVEIATTGGALYGPGADPSANWVAMQFTWRRSGGNVEFQALWNGIGSDAWALLPGGYASYAGAFGGPARVEFTGAAPMEGASLSSVFVLPAEGPLYTDAFRRASNGYTGETAGERMVRLCAEAGIPLAFAGHAAYTEVVGRQRVAPLLELLRDAAEADGGLLLGDRGRLGLLYRPRTSLYNQGAHQLSYTAGHISAPFKPLDDDSSVANDVTVSRPGGGTARVIQNEGPLSIKPPPLGVGTYDRSFDLGLGLDGRLVDHANWRKMLGTRDEARYPTIRVDLASRAYTSNPAFLARTAQIVPGEMLELANLPVWVPPGPTKALVQGWTEEIDGFDWSITYNASPGAVWDIATVDGEQRVPAEGTVTTGVGASDTSMLISSPPENGLWTEDSDDFPLELRIGGEKAIAGFIERSFVDVFTRTTANGWGAPWTVSQGTPADFYTNGSFGRIGATAINTEQHITYPVNAQTQDIRLWCTMPVTPVGAPINWGILLRYLDPTNYVWVDVQVGTDSSLTLRLIKRVAGVATVLGSVVSPVPHSFVTPRALRAEITGTQLRARVWSATSLEPSFWDLIVGDDGLVTGGTRAGAIARLMTGNTNATPVTFSFDNVVALQPQLVTLVARGVNGVNRAWPAGTGVDVWNPGIVPL